jgi:nucleoside-diphosphate-sugar epimerase
MIVYGDDTRLGETFTITVDTKPKPENFYGRSKFEAEIGLQALANEKFSVSIIRTPMVYGQGCKGNFPRLVDMAKKLPIFPDLNNQRSMIYIDNLCAYLKLVIDNKITGVLFPQNTEYVSTKDIILHTSRISNHKVFFTTFFNPLLFLLSSKVGLIRKLFGTKVYDKSLSPDMESYNLYTFEQSMERYFKLESRT